MRRILANKLGLWTGWLPAVILGVQLVAASPQSHFASDALNDAEAKNQQDTGDAPKVASVGHERLELRLNQLVEQLGAPKFAVRQAAALELKSHGLAARAHLIEALSHPDLEVQVGARACLNAILDSERDERLQVAHNEPGRLDELHLPGWDRFRAMIGSDADSRRLFLDIFAAEPQLVESAEGGGFATVESLTARCLQLQAYQNLPLDKSERQASFASVAALVFVGTDPTANLPSNVQTAIMSHLNKSAFQSRLRDDDSGAIRRLIAAWIHHSGDCAITYQNLLLAARYNVKEVVPAAKELAEDATNSPESRMYGILVVGKLGGIENALWMTQFLDDESVCSAYAYLRDGSRGRYETQLRDVALATLIYLTEQDHNRYGFRRLRGHSQILFNTSSIGFAVGEPDRDDSLRRWKMWQEENPLPESPLVAPPGSISFFGRPTRGSDTGADTASDPTLRVAQIAGAIPNVQVAPPQAAHDDKEDLPAVAPVPGDAAAIQTNAELLGNLPTFYLTDRQVRIWLTRAELSISEGEFLDAAKYLDAALNSPLANSYQPNRLTPIHVGIRAEAERQLSRLSAAGLNVYESYVGATAERQLQSAVKSRNALAVADIARRYFYTKAGAQAELLWGIHLYDYGQPMAAAAAFERVKSHPHGSDHEPDLSFRLAASLAQAGYPQKAEQVFAKNALPRRGAEFIAGEQRYKPNAANPFTANGFVDWLSRAIDKTAPQWTSEDWPVFGGDPSRNRLVQGERPLLRARWSVETIARPEIQDALTTLSQAYADQRRAAVPGAHPIAVKDTVIARTPTGLLAVNLLDGKARWSVQFDSALEERLINELKHGNNQLLYRELDERMWRDAASGRISSDGERVYAIDNSGQVGDALSQRMLFTQRGHRRLEPRWRDDQNRLVAFDLATEGKTAWMLGGPEGECALPLAGAYFLGPPLPLGGQLYVLIERDQLIQLLALDAETGCVIQTLTLASLDPSESEYLGSVNSSVKSATRHAQRRSGSLPAYKDGILVCPTSDGGFASVDLSRNEVIWSYRATPRYLKEAFKVWQAPDEETPPLEPRDPRLLDGEIMISGDKVLVAPLEMSALLCLDLYTGVVRWERPLNDLRYIATSNDDSVLLIGRSKIRSINLATGRRNWADVSLPAGSAPSGRGFGSGDKYFLPLSTAELAVVDIASGAIESRLKSNDAFPPGNLICVSDYVVSQSVDRLEIFEQLSFAVSQAKAELETSGPTATALARYGETLLHSGDYSLACENLYQSYQLEANPQTLTLMCQALLEAMDISHDRFAPLAKDVLSKAGSDLDVETRRRFIRLNAQHAEQQGQIVAAFEAVVALIELSETPGEVIARGPALDASELAWLCGSVKRLQLQANFQQLSAINSRIMEIYDELPDEPKAIARFAKLFSQHPLADTCLLRLLDDYKLADPLERQWAILQLAQSRREEIRRDAVIRQFDLFVDNGRLMEAAYLIRELQFECENVQEQEVLNQIVGAKFTENKLWRPEDSELPKWPLEAIREDPSDERAPYGKRYILELDGARDAYQNDLQFEIRSDAQSIVARNLHEIKRWEADLRENNGEALLPMNPEAVRVRQVGHVLVVWRGHEVLAIDLMTPPTAEARVLWRKSLLVSFPGRPVESSVVVRAVARPGEMPRLAAFNRSGIPLGQLGPVNRSYVAYLRGHTLEAVHPLTGEVLWRRHDVPPGSQLFGDEEYLIYVEPDCRIAIVLQAEDGQELGRALAPPAETWVNTVGRRIVSWSEGAGPRLSIVDPAQALLNANDGLVPAKVLYERKFVPGACVYRIGWNQVAACDPAGNFTVVDCENAEVLIDDQLPAQPEMNALYVMRSPDQFVAMISGPLATRDTVFPVPGGYQCPLVHGTAFGFDRAKGERVWATPIDNLSLDLTQPEYLPILAFAVRTLPPADASNQARRYSSHVFCLDRRSGAVLIDEQSDGSINRMQIAPDLDAKTIEIRTTQDGYLLRFPKPASWPAGDESVSSAALDEVLVAPVGRR